MSQRPPENNLIQDLRAVLQYCEQIRGTLEHQMCDAFDHKLSLNLDRIKMAEENLKDILRNVRDE